ncbi:hypothetical protein SAMN04489740_1788 [Arthrobacter alpinus]|uniref:Uncharacterized protein n=1 Tax=Arthrobacter alpinus TaxID=656366 RepID=A0A1H5JXZ2_9MICC|nr:hypothetical protein SAMN04489740_1788 [Arthrobacter alpinus]
MVHNCGALSPENANSASIVTPIWFSAWAGNSVVYITTTTSIGRRAFYDEARQVQNGRTLREFALSS